MPFTGQAEAVIDAKQRLALPAKFRARWDARTDGPSWYAVPWFPDRALRLYTETTFEALFQAGRTSPSLFPDEEERRLEQAVFSHTEQLELDANHRVRLPSWMIDKLGLPREVIVIGVGDRLEVHSRADWAAGLDDLVSQMSRLAEARRKKTENG